jgi:signal transduction histidine kinase
MNRTGLILVVDDEPTAHDIIEGFLFNDGYDLVFASNGIEALECLKKLSPDVILLDVMMPGMDGFELCHRLKSNEKWQSIPVILVTTLNSKEDMIAGFEAGANDFLTKPVNEAELRARVRSMLRIKQQYDKLEANLQLREDLAHMLVHDIRSPLVVILGYSDLLVLKTNNSPEYAEELNYIKTQARRLDSFLNDILTLAKTEAGQPILNRSLINVNQLVQQIEEIHKVVATSKKIQLISILPVESPPMLLDSNLIYRMLDNLVSNALKFSPAQTSVTIRVEYRNIEVPLQTSEAHLRIQVLDEGPGIAEEHREGIFDKYKIIALQHGGVPQVGLGLAFCKMVAEAHGGRILVEANKPVGSIFTVEM